MSLNKANFLKTLGAATVIILGTQSCNLHKNLSSGWQYNDSKEKSLTIKEKPEEHQNKSYRKLVRRLSKEYSNQENRYPGTPEDKYSYKYRSIGGKESEVKTINHLATTKFSPFTNRELFYQQILGGYGEGKYGLIIKFTGEDYSASEAYKIYDTIEAKDFDGIIKKTENSPLIWSQDEDVFKAQYGDDFKTHLSKSPEEEKMLFLLPEYYYNQIKDCEFETHGTLLDKPSDKILRFADKHGFVLNPKILVLKNITSYDTKYQKADHIELQGIYIWLPEKKPETLVQDTISQITQEQIQETEKQMNEIFEYGQKSIFKSNSKEFSNETVEEGLDKLYDMLEKNPSLKIKVTGYYGGVNSTLPLERAEKVKQYLVKKGISAERITAQGGKEQIAKSIKIEIIK